MFARAFQRRLGLGLNGLGFAAAMMMASGAGAQPITGAFNFQGELVDGGTPAAGLHDMRFRLFDAASGGAQVGSVLCADNVQVAAGRFVTTLDFGVNAFAGQRRYLEIDVRSDSGLSCANTTGYTTLGPRIEVGATPYATFAPTAGAAQTAASATNATNAASLNGQPASFYNSASNLSAGVLADARLSTNVPRLNAATSAFTGGVSATTLTGTHVGDGTGVTNLNASNVASGTLADARLSANVPRLNAANVFSGALTAASFAGSGAGLVNLSASNVASGTLADARLSSNIPRLNAANTFALGMTINGDVGIGTSTPEAPLHVRGGGSLGGIVVTPDVTDTQSQILLAENTTASNAMLMRYNGTTNNLEFRGLAADVESAAHMTINRDSGAVVIDPATATGDASVQLPTGSISATETLNEAGVASVSNTTAVTLPVQVTSTVDTVTINAPTSGKVVVLATVQFSNPDFREQFIRSVISNVSTASATSGYMVTLRGFDTLGGQALPETFTMHKVFTVAPGSNTFYLRSRPINDAPVSFAPPTADDIALTATFFPTTY